MDSNSRSPLVDTDLLLVERLQVDGGRQVGHLRAAGGRRVADLRAVDRRADGDLRVAHRQADGDPPADLRAARHQAADLRAARLRAAEPRADGDLRVAHRQADGDPREDLRAVRLRGGGAVLPLAVTGLHRAAMADHQGRATPAADIHRAPAGIRLRLRVAALVTRSRQAMR